MTKDEMKNRISLALKDPILQQGFELICKENAELKLKVEGLEGQTPWKDIKDKSEVLGKLSKAKEIIKGLLNSCFGYNSKTVNYEVKAKAEQFLKESEVEE